MDTPIRSSRLNTWSCFGIMGIGRGLRERSVRNSLPNVSEVLPSVDSEATGEVLEEQVFVTRTGKKYHREGCISAAAK